MSALLDDTLAPIRQASREAIIDRPSPAIRRT
jgi:hypothetical protein